MSGEAPARRMTPAERADTYTRALAPALRVLADPDSPPEAVTYARSALAKITAMIDRLHGLRDGERSPETALPHAARTRAREAGTEAEAARLRANTAREAEGLQALRKGRRQCEATTRAGRQCKAPAVPGSPVCRVHGASAPQVRIQAAMTVLYEARYDAYRAWEAARGTPGEFDALCAVSRAENAVNDAEAKLERLRELRAEARRLRKGDNAG